MEIHGLEITVFGLLTVIVGLLLLLRITIVTLVEFVQSVMDCFIGLHQHVKRFRERMKGGSSRV